jgi:hypothetical protein
MDCCGTEAPGLKSLEFLKLGSRYQLVGISYFDPKVASQIIYV